MTEKSVEQQIKEILADRLGKKPEEITGELKLLEDLGLEKVNNDNFDITELFIILQEEFKEFNLEFTNRDTEKIKTVDDVINYVVNKIIGA